ncbi:2 [Amycolatopsis camponoti]|uniref:dTDP-4-dehydro-6-deoxy-alpha-D-glucopyranose 2,3-dehydratase domain-containing protein n=1 Tax=Amycolatopsis camponoti TaxID=2606593 RepID=A0A6I8LZF8_9PSEU|nr:NDP-hexose 2,3-dehydratase family protein [Amycolatopsis camponoti]VVJ20746.1 2 [Amycolatopsis camponoti] [Amycolatopsis camponoti]
MPTATPTGLLRHTDASLPERIAESAATIDGMLTHREVLAWLESRRPHHVQEVRRIPFAELGSWDFDPGTGNLAHASGRFFSVEGLRVRSDFGPVREWSQPIIHQPEIGILGIAVREIDGVFHCLMQAKAEPGNPNGLQVAPTVQATRSNYTRVHGGRVVPYLEHFAPADPRQVIADVLQSEQGAWFYRKRNRNMVVEVGPEVEAGEDFQWLTLGQLHRLLHLDNVVNMDARTVLSCLPAAPDTAGSLHTTAEVLSWITRMHTEHELVTEPVPLREIEHWHRTDTAIAHESGRFFSVVAVDVQAGCREVGSWQQPLLEPHGAGIVALLVKRFEGVVHALINARVEPGYLDVVELAPTVQCVPENYGHLPPYVDLVRARRPERTWFDVEFSEEGGRFYDARSRYVILEVDDGFSVRPDGQFQWLTLSQLTVLLQHRHYLNVQARTLVAALRALM